MAKRRSLMSVKVYCTQRDIEKIELFRNQYASKMGMRISISQATLLLLRQVFSNPKNQKIFGKSTEIPVLETCLPEIVSPQEIAKEQAKKEAEEEQRRQDIKYLGDLEKDWPDVRPEVRSEHLKRLGKLCQNADAEIRSLAEKLLNEA